MEKRTLLLFKNLKNGHFRKKIFVKADKVCHTIKKNFTGGIILLKRKIEHTLEEFLSAPQQTALLITGARQVGKTYIIRECAKRYYDHIIEINFIENPEAKQLFQNAHTCEDILIRLSAIANQELPPGKTLIFFDEVQELKDIVTAIKFLVEDGRFQYVLSGSLLGVELKDIRSVPVGFLRTLEMYPMDFFEFCDALSVNERIISHLRDCFEGIQPVDELIHNKMMELFYLYLIVGGMPAVVQKYVESKDLREVEILQKNIVSTYKKDIAKYDPRNKLYLNEIFDLIPSELNAKNKRFIMKSLNQNFKLSRYENSFIWLKDAGVATPCYCVEEPRIPLLLSKATNLFKLFLSDVGLLCSLYGDGLQIKILSGELTVNFGSIFENAIAQQLQANGFPLYYFNSKSQGELDFVIEYDGSAIPIEVKSGKNYTRHHALSNVLENLQYAIPYGIVFSGENVSQKDSVRYYPIYMIGFLERNEAVTSQIYAPDFSILQ